MEKYGYSAGVDNLSISFEKFSYGLLRQSVDYVLSPTAGAIAGIAGAIAGIAGAIAGAAMIFIGKSVASANYTLNTY